MANITINFLHQRHKQLTMLQKTDRRYAMILGYITTGVVIASISLFGLQLYLTSAVESVKKQQNAVTGQIASLASVEYEYLTLARKFTEIQTFLKGKSVQQEAIEYFSTLFAQQQTTLNEVNREKDGVIQFKISATNIFRLQQVMGVLQQPEVLSLYPSLALSELNREKTGVYTTTVSVALPIVSPAPAPKKTIKPLNSTE